MWPVINENVQIITGILGSEWVEENLDQYARFRDTWSPANRWAHRRPTVSPIVPLLYWGSGNSRNDISIDDPMGHWWGDPGEQIGRIGEFLLRFERYWNSLPNDNGIKNLRWALTSPQRFFSLNHELSVAAQLELKSDLEVEPWFLNPISQKGQPDILVRTSNKEFSIQCKSEDPTQSGQLSYDVFQFFAGAFAHIVEQSSSSFHLSLHLKRKMDMRGASRLLNRLRKLVKTNLVTPSPIDTKAYDLEIYEIGTNPGAIRFEQLKRVMMRQPEDPLYQEVVPIENGEAHGFRARRMSSLLISGRRGRELDSFIRTAINASVKTADQERPLIVAVHLYQEIDFEEFSNRPSIKEGFLKWTDEFFIENQNVPMIWISSNHERYTAKQLDVGVGLGHSRHYWVLESPVWNHEDVKELGF